MGDMGDTFRAMREEKRKSKADLLAQAKADYVPERGSINFRWSTAYSIVADANDIILGQWWPTTCKAMIGRTVVRCDTFANFVNFFE